MAGAAATLLAGLGVVPSSSDPAAGAGWRPTPGALFNVPRSKPANELRLENQVVAAINHARRGSTIKMSMFSFDRTRVADALIAAHHNRGVHVQVIVNNHEFPRAQHILYRRLHQNRVAPSWYYQCRAACRGQGDVQHSKFVLFSQTGDAKDVVMLGSLNMKKNGVVNQFNDLLTVNNSPVLYNDLSVDFDQMKLDRNPPGNPTWYDGVPIDNEYKLWVMPFPRGGAATAKTKWTWARDPINRLLAPVHCFNAATKSGRTIVRVDMHAWDGTRGALIARRFEALWRDGCDVKIQVGFAGAGVRKIFAQNTARGRIPIRSTGFDTNKDGEIDLYSHEKILLINGRYGKINRKVVVTGSSNYQDGGQYGDEIIFRVYDAHIYSQYAANWQWSWANHTHGFRTINTEPPPPERAGARATQQQRVGVPILVDGLGTDSPQWRDE
jgi:phosphatidylserine/phosphatidylglycerophosphate/cardiolipin synthase-like enzyme